MSKRTRFFKKLAKEHYTILAPDMLPIHFELIAGVLRRRGYNFKVVSPVGRDVKDEGLKAIHNDACYPALIVAGQFMKELKSGQYDLNHTAVIMSQTGGGCRASNYISLLRKAFEKEFPTVPVLSLNLSGLEKDQSLPFTIPLIRQLVAAITYGDMIMTLYDQALPYHNREEVEKAKMKCIETLSAIGGTRAFLKVEKNTAFIMEQFKMFPPDAERKPKVAIVGEIYVKYSPYANNNLAEFLRDQNVEVVYPSLTEFILYCIYNIINDDKLYGKSPLVAWAAKKVYKYFLKKSRKMNQLLIDSSFSPFEDFEYVVSEAEKIISTGVKMGEGWLIPAEMLAYADSGITNIVCAQPFGCLPNHIVGKGMMRPLKRMRPDINIVPLDFDASSSQVNQENRLKLMLANLRR